MKRKKIFPINKNKTFRPESFKCDSLDLSRPEFKEIAASGCFDGCGYTTAATYIRRAKLGMFGYIRRWLKWGLISPRASSMVERGMREPGRRLKKTACGWSDKGATKIARIILKRFTNAKAWEDYWQNKLY